jgi:hypothetical protein
VICEQIGRNGFMVGSDKGGTMNTHKLIPILLILPLAITSLACPTRNVSIPDDSGSGGSEMQTGGHGGAVQTGLGTGGSTGVAGAGGVLGGAGAGGTLIAGTGGTADVTGTGGEAGGTGTGAGGCSGKGGGGGGDRDGGRRDSRCGGNSRSGRRDGNGWLPSDLQPRLQLLDANVRRDAVFVQRRSVVFRGLAVRFKCVHSLLCGSGRRWLWNRPGCRFLRHHTSHRLRRPNGRLLRHCDEHRGRQAHSPRRRLSDHQCGRRLQYHVGLQLQWGR